MFVRMGSVGAAAEIGGQHLRYHSGSRENRQRRRLDPDAIQANRFADRVGIARGIDQGIGRAELLQAVNVAIPDQWFAMQHRPPRGAFVEVQRSGEHPIVFNGVEQIGSRFQHLPQACRRREIRVRRNDEPAFVRAQSS